MVTRGKDNQNPGKFAFRIYDEANTLVRREGGFDTAQEADRAAERAHREVLFPAVNDDIEAMSDDELLAALTA